MADTADYKGDPYYFNTPGWSDGLGWTNAPYYKSIQCADVTGNGQADMLARSSAGIVGAYYCKELGNRMIELPSGPPMADVHGWSWQQYNSTIQYADIDGDGRDELIARDSRGIVVYKLFDPPVDLVPKGLEMVRPSFMTWGEMPRGPGWSDEGGWDQPAYYSTIQTADINGDGKAELIARGAGGIVAYSFDPNTQVWTKMPNGPKGWAPDEGWSEPDEYLTIQSADLLGNGRAAIFGRCKDGIRAISFEPEAGDPTKGTWRTLADGPAWTNAGAWGMSQFSSTIQAADFDGNGKAILVARSASRVDANSYDPKTDTWKKLADGPNWGNDAPVNGWSDPSSFSTIQTADFTGDGKALLFGRSRDGICVYGYSSATNTWTEVAHDGPMSNKTGWDHPQYYETIQSADINGDGKDELIARDVHGMLAYGFEGAATKQWPTYVPNRAKTPFKNYTGEAQTAYSYISKTLLPNAQFPNIRNQYDKTSHPTLWISALKEMAPAPGVSETIWNEVKKQLLLEFACVLTAQTFFSQSQELINYLQTNRAQAVASVLTNINMSANHNSASPMEVTLTKMFLGILDAVATGMDDGVGVAAGIFGSLMGAAISGDPNGGATTYSKAAQLDGWVDTQFRESLAASVTYERQVLTDWGLLGTLGTLAGGGGPWERSEAYVSAAELTAYKPFRLWVYQQLMPFEYNIHYWKGLSQAQVYQVETDWQWPDHAGLLLKVKDDLFDLFIVSSGTAIGYPTSACINDILSNGGSMYEFLLGRNGWQTLRRINMWHH